MRSGVEKRIEDLERRAEAVGKAPDPAIVLDLGAAGAIVDGERVTRAEYDARWPGLRPRVSFRVGNIDLERDL